jgi:mannonate dehydratase
MNRRQFLYRLSAFGMGTLALSACRKPKLMNPCLSGLPTTPALAELLKTIWQGVDVSQVWDSHVHIIGIGDSGGSVEQIPWLSPDMDSYWHPILSVQKFFYINGSCIDEKHTDNSYIDHLQALVSQLPAGFKVLLFAFDWHYDERGQAIKERSIFHIPNRYAAKIAHAHPSIFEWAASIHPYRADCVDALQKVHAEGARAIKWLPSAMGIDPLSKQCDRFYQAAADLKLPIISHTGKESAVQGGNQDFGNPLRLRRALDNGVRMVLAHCASDGDDVDLDQGANAERVKSYDLFARLMDEDVYKSLLYADISALPQRNHDWVLKSLLARPDWHSRLLNGSDYPLPGIVPLFNLSGLVAENLLAAEHQLLLEELQLYNPLLFDFALKRLLRFGEQAFPVSVFENRRFFTSA